MVCVGRRPPRALRNGDDTRWLPEGPRSDRSRGPPMTSGHDRRPSLPDCTARQAWHALAAGVWTNQAELSARCRAFAFDTRRIDTPQRPTPESTPQFRQFPPPTARPARRPAIRSTASASARRSAGRTADCFARTHAIASCEALTPLSAAETLQLLDKPVISLAISTLNEARWIGRSLRATVLEPLKSPRDKTPCAG